MDVDEYQNVALSTAIYPQRGSNLIYPVLGLAGESAELLEKLTEGAPADLVRAELGDVLWYCSVVAFELGLKLSVCLDSRSFPVASVSTTGAGVVIASGRVCELVKKAIRDEGGQISSERRQRLRAALADLLFAASRVGDLDAAAQANAKKLRDRADRGVLQGSGDSR